MDAKQGFFSVSWIIVAKISRASLKSTVVWLDNP
jgi:hypothetical protein